jgi:hypothetical protein
VICSLSRNAYISIILAFPLLGNILAFLSFENQLGTTLVSLVFEVNAEHVLDFAIVFIMFIFYNSYMVYSFYSCD